jgi:hypothetical protein
LISIDIIVLISSQVVDSVVRLYLSVNQNKIRYAQGQKIGKPNNLKGPS